MMDKMDKLPARDDRMFASFGGQATTTLSLETSAGFDYDRLSIIS